MELWRPVQTDVQRPKVLCWRNWLLALSLHATCFAVFGLYAAFRGLLSPKEELIPIDLTVVVNENLDGEENEPPPLRDPEPPPPPPKPQPKPQPKIPEKPKALERVATNVVAKAEKKAEKKEEKTPPKKVAPKPEPKRPEPPKKTAKELREERLRRMRESAKAVNKPVAIKVKGESGNGRTAKKTLSDAEIRRLLNLGYKPGNSEQLAGSELQLGLSLIKARFEEQWEQPPWTDTLKPMTIRVWFGSGGRVLKWKLEASSGDARADRSILNAASRVPSVPGLSADFVDHFKSRGVPLRFTVRPQ